MTVAEKDWDWSTSYYDGELGATITLYGDFYTPPPTITPAEATPDREPGGGGFYGGYGGGGGRGGGPVAPPASSNSGVSAGDIALGVLFVATIITPIPGDELLVGAVLAARGIKNCLKSERLKGRQLELVPQLKGRIGM